MSVQTPYVRQPDAAAGCDDAHGFTLPKQSFWMIVALLAILAAIKPILIDTLDPDLFWHLLVAKQLLRDGIGPLVDRISYCSMRAPWTPYSWLAELGMNAAWDWGGYRAALAAHAVLLAGVMFAVGAAAAECVPRSGSRAYSAAAVATAAAMMLIVPWFTFRPAALAIVLLAIIVWLIQRDRRLDERSRAIWLTPPITALLANIHLFSLAAPLFAGALFLGALVERFRAIGDSAPDATRRTRRYALLTLLAMIACCATPMLRGFVRAAAYYQFSDPMISSGIIAEMQPFYQGAFGKIILAALAVIGLILLANRRQVRAGEWFMPAIGTALLVQHGRYAPLFALTLAPALTLAISDLSDHLFLRRMTRPLLAGLMLASLIAFALLFPGAKVPMDQWVNRRGPGHSGFPCAAAQYVSDQVHPATGRLINEFTWGGYLAWRLHDRYQVLLDGRTQVYPPEFWRSVYLGDDAQRRQLLAGVHADAAILPLGSSLFQTSLERQNWRIVFADDCSIVMVPPNDPPR